MALNPLKTNLSGITNAATTISKLASLVMVSPQDTEGYQPTNPPTADGKKSTAPLPRALLFQYEGEQILTIESDITDHWVENNTTIVDQIGLKPELFKTSGFIGELTDVLPGPLRVLQEAANALVTIDSYFPSFSVTALVAYTQALLIYENAASIARSAVSAFSSIATGLGLGGDGQIGQTGTFIDDIIQNKQQLMFQQFYGYWNNRTLFNIQTPWCILTDMAIQSLRAIQDAETRMITDFEIIFKKIRTASTITTLQSISAARAATQSAPAQNNGIQNSSENSSESLGGKIGGVVP